MIEGIHQINFIPPHTDLIRPLAYIFESRDESILIDTGWGSPENIDNLGLELGRIGLTFRDVSRIIITHLHPDHYGSASMVKQLSGAKIIMHEKDVVFLEERYQENSKFSEGVADMLSRHGLPEKEFQNLRNAKIPSPVSVKFVKPDIIINGGEHFHIGGERSLQVIHTPGHSPGHICLYDQEKKLLISGDHVLPHITPNISLHLHNPGNPLKSYLKSLKQIRGLNVGIILPGHGYCFTDLQQRIREIEHHHEQRILEILSTFTNGPQTTFQIALKIAWSKGPFPTLSSWHKRMALTETLAHMQYLKEEGRIEVTENEVISYKKVS